MTERLQPMAILKKGKRKTGDIIRYKLIFYYRNPFRKEIHS